MEKIKIECTENEVKLQNAIQRYQLFCTDLNNKYNNDEKSKEETNRVLQYLSNFISTNLKKHN